MKSDKRRQLIAATALMPLLAALHKPPDLVPFLYSLFAIAYFIHEKKHRDEPVNKEPEKSQMHSHAVFHFTVLFLATALTGVVLAWTTKKLAPEENTALLLSPYLGNALLISTAEFAALAGIWLALSRWRKFDLRQVFFIQGLLALVLDPHAISLCTKLSGNFFYTFSELCGLFMIYGSIVALPWTTFAEELAHRAKSSKVPKFLECTAGLVLLAAAGKLGLCAAQMLLPT